MNNTISNDARRKCKIQTCYRPDEAVDNPKYLRIVFSSSYREGDRHESHLMGVEEVEVGVPSLAHGIGGVRCRPSFRAE